MSVLISMLFLTFCWRSIEEDDVLSQAHACEATIVYTGGCPPRAGRSRRVPLSGRKVETVAIRCPVQRTRIKATKKETFTACGEESTYQGTYTGVAFRASLEIPLISLGEKSKVMDPNSVLSLPRAPEDWVERNGEDCPLFWGESKPIALWCAILDEWKVQAVLDCSPGSGALMEAALTRCILYHGLCVELSLSQHQNTQIETSIISECLACSTAPTPATALLHASVCLVPAKAKVTTKNISSGFRPLLTALPAGSLPWKVVRCFQRRMLQQ